MLPFTNTDSNYKKWEISSRQIDVTEQTGTGMAEGTVEAADAVRKRDVGETEPGRK